MKVMDSCPGQGASCSEGYAPSQGLQRCQGALTNKTARFHVSILSGCSTKACSRQDGSAKDGCSESVQGTLAHRLAEPARAHPATVEQDARSGSMRAFSVLMEVNAAPAPRFAEPPLCRGCPPSVRAGGHAPVTGATSPCPPARLWSWPPLHTTCLPG